MKAVDTQDLQWPRCEYLLFLSLTYRTKSLDACAPLTHWFLDNPVVVWGVVCVHGLQEGPRHFMGLRRREPEKDEDHAEASERDEEQQTKGAASRWVNTDVCCRTCVMHKHTLTDCQQGKNRDEMSEEREASGEIAREPNQSDKTDFCSLACKERRVLRRPS